MQINKKTMEISGMGQTSLHLKNLFRFIFFQDPSYVSVHEKAKYITPKTLSQVRYDHLHTSCSSTVFIVISTPRYFLPEVQTCISAIDFMVVVIRSYFAEFNADDATELRQTNFLLAKQLSKKPQYQLWH